ncbi:hypothetical protein [uncultured Marinobacter sp.]|uniref:hypothetical protein n=1 Tax=uncultured Marinobacter sp. TaxID=187379 RepID=UPI0025994554|nr:hypothetical protein [uncultured Marinobacter sp.]
MGSTLRAYFPSQAAGAESTPGGVSQPPPTQGSEAEEPATDPTDAAPSQTEPPPQTAPSDDADSEGDEAEEDARPEEPDLTPGPPAEDPGALFIPPLPQDHAQEEVEERPIHRKDPGADLPGFEPTKADLLLDSV